MCGSREWTWREILCCKRNWCCEQIRAPRIVTGRSHVRKDESRVQASDSTRIATHKTTKNSTNTDTKNQLNHGPKKKSSWHSSKYIPFIGKHHTERSDSTSRSKDQKKDAKFTKPSKLRNRTNSIFSFAGRSMRRGSIFSVFAGDMTHAIGPNFQVSEKYRVEALEFDGEAVSGPTNERGHATTAFDNSDPFVVWHAWAVWCVLTAEVLKNWYYSIFVQDVNDVQECEN